MDPTANPNATAPGGAPGAGGPPGGFTGPPDPSFIPAPPTELAKSVAYAFAGTAVTLNVISFLVFGGRIYARSLPVFRLAWDDYTIIVAYTLILANSILLLLTTPYTFGTDPLDMTMQDVINGNKYAIIAQPMWAWGMALIKISVAGMLLRLSPQKNMRIFLWVMIAVQLVLCIYNTVVQAIQCVPFEAAWDLLDLIPDKKCLSRETIGHHSIVVASINIATDVIFALLPINFLRKVQRPLRERIIIGVLMALGLFASIASIMKAVASARFGRTDDPNAEGITIGTWSCVEEQIAFIAACVPCLRSLFQSAMVRLGVTTRGGVTKGSGGGYGGAGGYNAAAGYAGKSGSGGAIRLKSLSGVSARSTSEENILEGAGDAKSQIWRTTEVTQHQEERGAGSINREMRDRRGDMV